MKRLIFILVLLFPAMLWARFEPVVKDIDDFFSSSSGYIIEISDNSVYTDLTSDDGAYPGKTYGVYRESETIKHPITGEILGKKKEKLGSIKIQEIFDKYSTATIIEKDKDFQKADLLISNPPVNVTLDFENMDKRLQLLLKQDLSKAKTIRISEENPEYGLKFTQDSSGGININIYAGSKSIKTIYYSDLDVGDPSRGTTVDLLRSGPIDQKFKSIAVGNLYNDDYDYIVAATDKSIYIYRFVADGFKFITKIKNDFSEIVSVEVADLNANGYDEIYVSHISNTRSIKSLIYEKGNSGDNFTLLKDDIPFLFRTALVNNEKIITAQRVSYDGEYYGNIYRYTYQNGFHRGEAISGTEEFGLYGFGMGNIDEDSDIEKLYVNDFYHLEVYDSGKRIYENNERLGDTPYDFVISEEIKKKLSSADYADEPFELAKYKKPLKGRIFVTSEKQVFMLKNKRLSSFLPNFDKYTESQFAGFKWESRMLRRVWESDVFKPVIVDYYLQERFGKVYVFLLRNFSEGLIPSDKSEFIYLEIK